MTTSPESLTRVSQLQQIDQIRQGFYPLEFSFDPSRPIFESARVSVQLGCDMAEVRGAAHRAMLSKRHAEEMAGRFVKVLWQLHGEAHLQQGSRELRVPPGHWTLYDAGRPYQMDMSEGSAFLALVFEVGENDKWLRLMRDAGSRVMKTQGESQLALGAVRSVLQDEIQLSSRGRALLKDTVWSFLSMQTEDDEGAALRSRAAPLAILLTDAQRYVNEHLGDPGLTPDRIAVALRVSRRTIYNAFHAEGSTPQAYIQRCRVERCRVELEDPTARHKSITSIALDFGFNDTAYFSRAFRRQFGHSPSEVRARALGA
ncbi:MAG: helix-turn-helix domain-containing protein [Pseudomonadota bacterium]